MKTKIEKGIVDYTRPKIEKQVPIPFVNRGGNGCYWSKLIMEMQPGDSVVLKYRQLGGLRAAAYRVGKVMTSRKITREEYRVWLMES